MAAAGLGAVVAFVVGITKRIDTNVAAAPTSAAATIHPVRGGLRTTMTVAPAETPFVIGFGAAVGRIERASGAIELADGGGVGSDPDDIRTNADGAATPGTDSRAMGMLSDVQGDDMRTV